MIRKHIGHFVFLFSLVILLSSCSSSNHSYSDKIKFDFNDFTDDGLRERPKGEFSSISYEFCIPADEEIYKEVLSIDSTVALFKGSKGRSACTDKEWLCIGNSRQPGFKQVITKLAKLSYIRKISETFWE